MHTILIIYHSQGGTNKRMAEAVEAGVQAVDGARSSIKQAAEAAGDDLIACDGLIIGSPEYFGYMAGAVKDFFDRTYESTHNRPDVFRKPYGIFVNAGNDGTGALSSIERICLGYKFKKVFEPIVHAGALTPDVLERCGEMGQTIAAGCVVGIY